MYTTITISLFCNYTSNNLLTFIDKELESVCQKNRKLNVRYTRTHFENVPQATQLSESIQPTFGKVGGM